MKKMNNLIALAVAAAVMSPMAALANNTPDNVGNVILLGNIVANSPMWQWTVNDYPGPHLDAKPSEATTENGVTTYKLPGQPFIAVSGYLPSMTGVIGPLSSLGTRDITAFHDGDGNAIADIQNLTEPQAVSFTIAANGTNGSGASVKGKLTLKATEIRGHRTAHDTNGIQERATNVYTAELALPALGGSCFTGSGGLLTVSGTAASPVITGASDTAASAFLRALTQADEAGAVRFANTGVSEGGFDQASANLVGCGVGSLLGGVRSIIANYTYLAAGHVVELTPTELSFASPVQGAWNATLNVTAYQM